MRRTFLLALVGLLAAVLVPTSALAAIPDRPLATRAQLAEGLLRVDAARRADTGDQAGSAVEVGDPGLASPRTRRLAAQIERRPEAPVPARLAHRALVAALGLGAERAGLGRLLAGDERLRVPRDLPAEVLVRELGLRENRPSPQDGLERTRREPLFAEDLARMLDEAEGLSSWQLGRVARYRDIALPPMGPRARTVVQAALAQVGQPYVWAGDAPSTRSAWGPQAHGGFDCSGLVWWAFKGDRRSARLDLGATIGGRTADAMAWEAPGDRIPASEAAPGDLVFFGARGPRTKKGAISHTGISLGDGWIVHSAGSRAGPSITHLEDYWPSGVAFARSMHLD